MEHVTIAAAADVSTGFDEKLAQPPMPMKRRAIQVEILTECLETLPIGQEIANRTDVSVIGAPLQQGSALRVC